ncbi:MAG: hypothetical protein QOG21_2076 [Actinomycetota bacterium]|nr:hypothetical protein [Actinomycetota bacterium]
MVQIHLGPLGGNSTVPAYGDTLKMCPRIGVVSCPAHF